MRCLKLIMKYFMLLFATIFSNQYVSAQQQGQEQQALGQAASNATNPLAFVTKLQVQPNFIWKSENARQLVLTTRIIQPTPSVGLPFIKSKDPSKVYTLYRIEIPLIGQTYPQKPSLDATGLSDMVLLDVIAFKQKWGLLGAGPGLIIPTYNPESISGGKWCGGFSGVALNTKTKGLQWGILFQQYFSFAGASDRPAKNFMFFQPIINKVLHDGYFIGFSPIMIFDWKNNSYTVPLSISFGRAFAKNLSAFIAPQYVVSGPNKGDIIIQFQLNAMFPPSKK
jgi:hypothetical protein